MINLLTDEQFSYILFTVIFFIVGFILKKIDNLLYFIYVFIGTVFHELLHFFIGLITIASPTYFSLIPKKNDNNWTLGSVSFNRLNFLNSIPVAFAPLLLLIIPFYFFCSLNFKDYIEILLYSFITYQMINSSIPSSQDLAVAKSSLVGIFLYLSLLLWGGYYVYKNNINIIDSFWKFVC